MATGQGELSEVAERLHMGARQVRGSGGLVCDCHLGEAVHVTMYGDKNVCPDCEKRIVAHVIAALDRPELIQLNAVWAYVRVQTHGDLYGR